ncbi:hypothetical protein CPAV1605_1046 [seawater metagenome]|uniref:Smr domain-containing protein n=1 Tax=seawater metagenome TaxID=1561972 RepID=A0A5E8CIU3_9ZZZZ
MNKNFITNLYFDYLPYFYNETLSLDELELDKDYRLLAQEIYESKQQLLHRMQNYHSKKIGQSHLSHELTKLNFLHQEYSAWGGLQTFYKNNKDTFFKKSNSVDLHGLYSKEVGPILEVIFYLSKDKLHIITGKGNGTVYKTTKNFLEKRKIKYSLSNNTFILK